MGKNDWAYQDPGHWEAPGDTSVSAGTPRWFKLDLQHITTRPAKTHAELDVVLDDNGAKQYGARGDDQQVAAGGRPNAPPGFFEPPGDTTVSAATPAVSCSRALYGLFWQQL
jgi:hypothetical protein